MTNPNTHPAPTMVYGGAPSFQDAPNPDPFCDNAPPSKFDLATVEYRDESPAEGYDFTSPVGPNTPTAPNPFAVIADLRAGLDVAKRLREHLPGDAPELQQADETIAALEAAIGAAEPAPSTTADLAQRMALADELATLRADNDARGQTIEQLRADRDAAQSNFSITAEALEYMRDERNQAHAAYSQMWGERDAANAELAAAKLRNEALAAELDTVRRDRDAAREELTAVLIELDRARMELAQTRRDRDKYFAAYNRTLRALNAALGEP